MSIYYKDDTVTVHHGDSLDVLKTLPDQSVDAVCTDPPYGLAELSADLVTAAMGAWLSGDRSHVPDGKGFMGRDWDRFVPPPALWDECWRVLKPGGHLLAFAAPRTVDLMTLSIRLARFDIRDSITWIFGNGFPKSLNVSEAVDRHRATRGSEAVDKIRAWLNARRLDAGLSLKEVNDALGAASNGGGLASTWMTNPTSKGMPDWGQWCQLKALLGFGDDMDGEVRRLHSVAAGDDRPVIGTELRDNAPSGIVSVDNYRRTVVTRKITAASSEAAATWDGWGTALKPAGEPIVVARKPLAGTVAATVVRHGTGAMNVAACTVGASAKRWPTNVVLSHTPDCGDICQAGCAVAELDDQSGILTSGKMSAGTRRTNQSGWAGPMPAATGAATIGDSGGASRYFPAFRYEAKADTSERPCVDGVAHPTVKPLALMRWLVRLVTPSGGVVLDPFAGSGTTAEACVVEGFRCITVERDATYLPLIKARLSKPIQPAMDLFGLIEGPVR